MTRREFLATVSTPVLLPAAAVAVVQDQVVAAPIETPVRRTFTKSTFHYQDGYLYQKLTTEDIETGEVIRESWTGRCIDVRGTEA